MNQTRDQIKALALKLLNSQGVEGVSTRDIAGKLRISVGNLTYHFPSKNDILLALCMDFIEKVDRTFEQLGAKQPAENSLVFFYQQCKLIGTIQQQYRFIFEARYAEIITSLPEVQKYYQQALTKRFEFYEQLHALLVKEKLAQPQLVQETTALAYLLNIVGLFWHQEAAIYFSSHTQDQKLAHALTVFFQLYRPYLTKKGIDSLSPYLVKLVPYGE